MGWDDKGDGGGVGEGAGRWDDWDGDELISEADSREQ